LWQKKNATTENVLTFQNKGLQQLQMAQQRELNRLRKMSMVKMMAIQPNAAPTKSNAHTTGFIFSGKRVNVMINRVLQKKE